MYFNMAMAMLYTFPPLTQQPWTTRSLGYSWRTCRVYKEPYQKNRCKYNAPHMLSNEEPSHPSASVSQPGGVDPKPRPINYQALLVTFMTFDIPTFHASLATRAEDAVFVSCTTALASQSDVPRKKYLFVNVDGLRFMCWSIWDHFSFPGICSVWGMLTLMVALVVDAMSADTDQNNCPSKGTCRNHFMIAKVMLSLVMGFVVVRFGFFMLHLRRISQALAQSESV
ncbi:hypothetical protein F5887DRAFT_300095 [Amanita rubescens]|nr:hypothetical protein F5887DRAFT_300095 [Amanita rubescens]